MIDVVFSALLSSLCAVIMWLNLVAWDETRDSRDSLGALSWLGCAAYWVVKMAIAVKGLI